MSDAEAPHDLLGVELAFEQQIEHAQARWIRESPGGIEQIDLIADRRTIADGWSGGRRVSLSATIDQARSREVDDEIWFVSYVTDKVT